MRISRLLRDRSGNVAIMFALALVPMVGAAGLAMDYSQAAAVRTNLQAALDATALAAARDMAGQSQEELEARAETFFLANFPDFARYKISPLNLVLDGEALEVTADGEVPTSLSSILGVSELDIAARSRVGWAQDPMEVVLVLDNTGSMAEQSKMAELKRASNAFLDIFQEATTTRGEVRVAVVPFNTQVNIETISDMPARTGKTQEKRETSPDWIHYPGPGSSGTAHWDGCVGDREMTRNLDTNDQPARTAEEASLYPGIKCDDKPAGVQPLTAAFGDLRATISSMQPRGYTNITIGLVWGLAALSPHAPLTETRVETEPKIRQVIILLTDGENTASRFVSPEDGSDAARAAEIDRRTEMACQSIKNAEIALYTIRVIEGNEALLQRCASQTGMYSNVEDVDDLVPVFQRVARDLTDLRLTK